MRTTTVRCLLVLLACVWATTCSTMPERLRKDIDRGRYQDAVLHGESYLGERTDAPDRPAVEELLVEARFRTAREQDSVGAYREFLGLHPKSPFTTEARAELARVQFETVTQRADTVGAYREFLREFPDGPWAQRAKERSARLAWRDAQEKGTVEALRGYRTTYADYEFAAAALAKELSLVWAEAERAGTWSAYLELSGAYVDTPVAEPARRLAQELSWREAEQAATAEAFLAVAARFADTPLAARASTRAEEIGWKAASDANDVEAYAGYRKHFPLGPHAEEAYRREEALAWKRAESQDKEETYAWFFEGYPSSAHAPTAEQRLLDLRYFNSSRAGEIPTARVNQVFDIDPQAVRLYVDARDRRNAQVAGLSREDFRVYENGRSAEIVDFLGMESNRPVDIVMIIDVSGSMSGQIAAVKASAIEFAELLRFRQRDTRLGLVTFVEKVEKRYGGRRLTGSARTFRDWVGSIKAGSGSRENPVQAILAATRYRFRRGAQRVFVLMTDEAPNVPFDPVSRKTTVDAGRLLLSQEATFYAVTPNVPAYREMVERTRGRFYNIEAAKRSGAFVGLMQGIANLLSMQYQIAYRSPRNIPTGGARKIRVRVNQQRVWMSAGELDAEEVIKLFPDAGTPCRLLAVTRRSGLHQSDDCGTSWSQLAGTGDPQPAIRAADGTFGAGAAVYLLTEAGRLLVLEGNTGELHDRTGELGLVEAVAAAPQTPLTVWILATSGQLYMSDDAAASTESVAEPLSNPSGAMLAVDPHAEERACVLLRDSGLRCVDADEEVYAELAGAGAPPLPWGKGSRLHFSPWRSDELYLIEPSAGLFRSTNGGDSFQALKTAPDSDGLQHGELVFGGKHDRYVCETTSTGVYCSSDGFYWHKVDGGLTRRPGQQVRLAHHPSSGLLLAGSVPASRGRGRRGRRGRPAAKPKQALYKLFDVANRELISGNVYFDSGSPVPKPALLPFLEQIGRVLARDRSLVARVEGHTDSDGSDTLNQELSRTRSRNVKAVLTGVGARGDQVRTYGYGESRPLFPNTSGHNKQRNRRVEVLTIREAERLRF